MRRTSNSFTTRLTRMALALCITGALVLGVVPAAPSATGAPSALTADIPAQPLAQALEAFAQQTGLHLVYVSEVVRDRSSHTVIAGLSADEALARLLEGTGLKFEFLTAHSVRILADVLPEAAESLPAPLGEPQPFLPIILVTGSRIPVPANITATSPLQIITAQDIDSTGSRDAVDPLNALPQVITSASLDGGNASNFFGITTADLRGLGPQRTIVLINGRRLGLGDANTGNPAPGPDLDQIPLAMVDRVEVLTGGAGATYGSDAVAGVVNFILKDHVEGVQIDGQYGVAEHSQQSSYVQGLEAASGTTPPTGDIVDGVKRDVSVIAGTGFRDESGHLTGYFTYHSQHVIYGSARDFADCTAFSSNYLSGVPTQPGVTCSGSGTSNTFVPNPGLGLNAYSVVGHEFVPWPAPNSAPPAVFNYAPYRALQRPDIRYQAGLLAHLELDPAAAPYVEFNFVDDRTQDPQAPSGIFQFTNELTPDGNSLVNCSNPLLSAQEAAILCTPQQIAADKAHPGSASADVNIGRRNIEGGGRVQSFEHRNYRAVVGVQGKLGEAWSYDAYALDEHTILWVANENYLNQAAIDNALQVTTDRSGRPVCISRGSCVPYDIFTTGGVTAQQLAYLSITGHDTGANSEQIFQANVTGQLAAYGFIVPWAREGVALNAGAEHRVETLRFDPDAAEVAGDFSGCGGNFSGPAGSIGIVAINDRASVDEGFVEIRVPVVQDRALTKDLTLGAGYRYSDYSTAGGANTYKGDLQFAPISDIRLRTSFEHVVRAPNLIELYTPLTYGAGFPSDPCAPSGTTRATASLIECMRTGVTAAQYGNGVSPAYGGTSKLVQCAVACGVVSGGNPGLYPESADTWSAGLTFTPRIVPALTSTVDYFHIRLEGEVGSVPAAVTLNQCLDTGDPTWCSQIVRTPAGSLFGTVAGGGYVVQRATNTGNALVSGTDLQLNYRQQTFRRWGALSASLTGTWMQHNAATPYRSAPSYDCAGLFGPNCENGSVNPTWRHNLRLTWETPWNVQLSAQWRFIGRSGFDNNSPQPFLQNVEEGSFDPVLTHIPSYSYFDLSAIWAVTPHLQVRAGVNNVLDKDPPFIPQGDISGISSGVINTFPNYDVVGRSIFIALRATL